MRKIGLRLKARTERILYKYPLSLLSSFEFLWTQIFMSSLIICHVALELSTCMELHYEMEMSFKIYFGRNLLSCLNIYVIIPQISAKKNYTFSCLLVPYITQCM